VDGPQAREQSGFVAQPHARTVATTPGTGKMSAANRTRCAQRKRCAPEVPPTRAGRRRASGTPHAFSPGVKIVVFGLAVSSSWGNGHATLWRALGRALGARGHEIVFFERDAPYYAQHRDGTDFPGIALCIYRDLRELGVLAAPHLADADAVIVTSFCPEGAAVSRMVHDRGPRLQVFYDLDTPVTLDRLGRGEHIDYLPRQGLGGFDLVLSYTGGQALEALRRLLGARRVAPLYGSVDPEAHHRSAPRDAFRGHLSYLGTYSEDRQPALAELLLEPARRSPDRRFILAGALYPPGFPWRENTHFVRHLPPGDHPAFFASSRWTLNVTRAPMAALGFCPSGRLFEAAACGAAIVTDAWEGLDRFFAPGEEIVVARQADDVMAALELPEAEAARLAGRARARVLACHTAERRAAELEALLEEAAAPGAPRAAGGVACSA
jgi:spore maturation protein CgeB